MNTASQIPQTNPETLPEALVDELARLHAQSVENLRTHLKRFLEGGPPPGADERAAGLFAYPELRLSYHPEAQPPRLSRAYARLVLPGDYAVTITHPNHFRRYLTEQIALLQRDYAPEFEVGLSQVEIPFP